MLSFILILLLILKSLYFLRSLLFAQLLNFVVLVVICLCELFYRLFFVVVLYFLGCIFYMYFFFAFSIRACTSSRLRFRCLIRALNPKKKFIKCI